MASSDRVPLAGLAPRGSLGNLASPPRAKRRRDGMLDDDVLRFSSFDTRCYVSWRVIAFFVGCMISGGILLLLSSWQWFRRPILLWMSVPVRAQDAEFALVTAADGTYEVCPVEPIAVVQIELLVPGSAEQRARLAALQGLPLASRMVVYRHCRFVLNPDGLFTLLE